MVPTWKFLTVVQRTIKAPPGDFPISRMEEKRHSKLCLHGIDRLDVVANDHGS